MAMTLREALEVVAACRGQRVVMPTMGAIAVWPTLSDTPLDFAYMPSSMGQGPALALGLALARPERGVVSLTGDGSLLMNLGCLATIAHHPANLWLVLLDNGLYEITGGQMVAGAGRIDFAALARGAGLSRVYQFASCDEWRRAAAEVFAGAGPVFVWLKLEGRTGQKTPTPPHPMAEQIQRLRNALDGN
jgi:thiamine pyrophosphate-dependent acetolactate synthase large subunit-like protein